jgi:hypothetical protein
MDTVNLQHDSAHLLEHSLLNALNLLEFKTKILSYKATASYMFSDILEKREGVLNLV